MYRLLLLLMLAGCEPDSLSALTSEQPADQYGLAYWLERYEDPLFEEAVRVCAQRPAAPNCRPVVLARALMSDSAEVHLRVIERRLQTLLDSLENRLSP